MTRAYIADNVQIVDEGNTVTAVWIADEEAAKDPRAALHGGYYWTDGFEIVASAERFYKSEGADFSGWIVCSGSEYTDPISGKGNALRRLKDFVREHFTCGQKMVRLDGNFAYCTKPKGHDKAHMA